MMYEQRNFTTYIGLLIAKKRLHLFPVFTLSGH